MGPLDGITVLDVTQVVSGPFASMTLADLGAEVVKIERPDGGDIARSNPPYVHGQSAYFAAVNRNKKSVALDLKSAEGQAAALALAEEADVLIENAPPGRMERFGLDYETVREYSEEIVYCSITGFGQTGPYRERPALDIVVQAMSGIASITGPPEGPPCRAGIPVGDIAGATYAVQAVLAALYDRARGGGGEYVDVSMLDCAISWLTVRAGDTFATGERYPRMGNELDEYVPYGIYEAADAPLAVVVATDDQWARLCTAIGRPGLADDDRFATTAARREHREDVEAALETALAEHSAAEWFERFAGAGVPAAPVYDTRELWDDEHVAARDLRTTAGESERAHDAIRYPVRFERQEAGIERGVPRLGEHTREALERAGYDDSEIDAFEAAIREHYPDDGA
jgi:crotonobetainyl-CoA:carnitine CoA-transferase CaiB-like acyl-CoA transferase